jgi:hypothetical protein
MNALYLVSDLTGPTVFFAAIIGLLAQPQVLRRVSLTVGDRGSALLGWHRRVGRIAVVGLVVGGLTWSLTSEQDAFIGEPTVLAHGILCAVCALIVLRKVWGRQRQARRKMRQVFPWVTATLAVGASFVALTCVLVAGRWTAPSIAGDRGGWLIHQAEMIGHMGLGMALIWLGRLALRNPPKADCG